MSRRVSGTTVDSKYGPIEIKCAHTQLLDPAGLEDHPDNNNEHTEEQIEWGMKVIRKSGWRIPILVSDRKDFIVSGHLRKRIALALGMTKVPVDIQHFKSRAEEVKHLTADNELARLSEFDEEKFVETLSSLKEEMDQADFAEFTMDANEFALDDFPDIDGDEDEDDDGADDVPEVKDPVSKKGDVWLMGKHKLLCGDSSEVDNVSRLLGPEKADLVFTDPPYKMNMQGGVNQPVGKAARKLGNQIEHLCDFSPALFLNNLKTAFKKGVMNAYIFCNKDLIPDYLNWGIKNGYSFNILFWKKPSAIPLGGSHRPDVEYLILLRKSAIWNNGLEGVSYSKCLEFGRETSGEHPTMKPVGLIMDQVQISSSEGGIVFEYFMGSGSTLIACQKTGRRCFGIELDETYTDVAVRRWEEFTGEKAVLEKTGQTYEQVRAERKGKKKEKK